MLLCLLCPSALNLAGTRDSHDYPVAGIENDSTFTICYDNFKELVRENDSLKIASLVFYPLFVNYSAAKFEKIKGRKERIQHYSCIFAKKLKRLILHTSADSLSAFSDGIMLGSGPMWFLVTGHVKTPIIKIISINYGKWLH